MLPTGFGNSQKYGAEWHGVERKSARQWKEFSQLSLGSLRFVAAVHETDHAISCFSLKPGCRAVFRQGRGTVHRHSHLPEARRKHRQFFGKEHPALLQKSNMAPEALNLRKIMAREKDRGLRCPVQQAFDQFISHQRI